mgnify:CR=1 FL=1
MAAHYVLVGSGIAAVAAAEAIRERDPSGRITMVSLEPHPFYSRPGLAYLLRGDIPEKQLAVRSPDERETARHASRVPNGVACAAVAFRPMSGPRGARTRTPRPGPRRAGRRTAAALVLGALIGLGPVLAAGDGGQVPGEVGDREAPRLGDGDRPLRGRRA